MKNLFKLTISILYLLVLVSCSGDSPNEPQVVTPRPNVPEEPNDDTGGNDQAALNFGFLDGNANTYIEMPIENSTAHLFIGRWKITKLGVDESNEGKIKYYNYQDYDHTDCGQSFLQFNNDGVVFENNYYKNNNACKLYANSDKWELMEANRFKIGIYDIIYLVEVTQTELVLKYDWNGSAWGPLQVYYHYERILPPD